MTPYPSHAAAAPHPRDHHVVAVALSAWAMVALSFGLLANRAIGGRRRRSPRRPSTGSDGRA